MPEVSENRDGEPAYLAGGEPYLAIEKHALLSDRRSAALAGANGRIDWWCLPDFDGEPVFGALLDHRRGGYWHVGPDSPVLGEQEYIDDSTVVRTRWAIENAELELVDALLWPERDNNDPYPASEYCCADCAV